MAKNCWGSKKPDEPKNKVCDPEETFYQHVMSRDKPKFCLLQKKKLQHFQNNIRMYAKKGKEYVKKDKKKYELLKLKTERK